MTPPTKIGPYVPGLTDEEAREQRVLAEYQEMAIRAAVVEPTKGVLIGDDMGAGKTVQAIEIMRRLDLPRNLIVAPRNAITDWIKITEVQTDGKTKLRRLDSTAKGKAAFADFLAGEPGHYISNTQWLTKQDYEYEPAVDEHGQPIYKVKKSTGEMVKKAAPGGRIFVVDTQGVAEILTEVPVQETYRIHLSRYVGMKPLDVLIFDEFHAIQNRKSITFRTFNTIRTDWRIGMSGTWHGNNFAGAWATSRWVWPDRDDDGEYIVDRSFHRWVEQWCKTATECPKCHQEIWSKDATSCDNCREIFTQSKRPIVKVIAEKNEGEFVKTLPLYFRRLPFPKIPQPRAVYVDITPAQRAQYEQMEEEMIAWVRDHEGIQQPIVADLPIVKRQRLRTATLGVMSGDQDGEIWFADDCESAKLVALRGIVDAWAGEPVLIFTDSKRFAKVVARRMKAAGYRAEEWTGDITAANRDALKARFIAGEVDYIVASISALSEAVDGLQRRCSRIIWLSRSENELLNSQASRRIWRPGVDQEKFMQVDILANDTLDAGTFSRLARTRARNLAQMAG